MHHWSVCVKRQTAKVELLSLPLARVLWLVDDLFPLPSVQFKTIRFGALCSTAGSQILPSAHRRNRPLIQTVCLTTILNLFLWRSMPPIT